MNFALSDDLLRYPYLRLIELTHFVSLNYFKNLRNREKSICAESTLMMVIEQPDDILPEYRLLNAIAAQKSANLLGKTDELF